jgi:hypothetical protein
VVVVCGYLVLNGSVVVCVTDCTTPGQCCKLALRRGVGALLYKALQKSGTAVWSQSGVLYGATFGMKLIKRLIPIELQYWNGN